MDQKHAENIWTDSKIAQDYLEGTRAAIPLATEQITTILKIIKIAGNSVNRVLDVGCGDGILGRAIAQIYPKAEYTFSDMSEAMINAVKAKLRAHQSPARVNFHSCNMEDSHWQDELLPRGPYDVIISGLAIHHLTHRRKRELYADIYDLLSSDGIFLNLERVESRSDLGVRLNNENYIDSLYAFHSASNSSLSREEIGEKYYYQPLKQSNILATAEMQTEWLRDLGFVDVDIFFKIFEIAIFGGRKRSKVL